MKRSLIHVMIAEDRDAKYIDIKRVVQDCLECTIERAKTQFEAENIIRADRMDALILDISMDISGSSLGDLGGGHANLAGLDIVDAMFLLEREMPTIVLTGFDYFPAMGMKNLPEMINLEDLDALVYDKIGTNYLGSVRYNRGGWEDDLRIRLGKIQ